MSVDSLSRYIFENLDVRGEIVQLEQTYQNTLKEHNYPNEVKRLLGELLAATSLLTATLKYEGDITVQIQGDGPISLLVVNGTHQQSFRAYAQFSETVVDKSLPLREMVGKKSFLAITLTPKQGERYQGIVAIETDNISQVIEAYFTQSEQLQTRLWLFANEHRAAGLMIQALPNGRAINQDFEHLEALTGTIREQELLQLDAQEILFRLYHQESVRLLDTRPVKFECFCSKNKSLNALKMLDEQEIKELFEQESTLKMNCQFCGKQYLFTDEDIKSTSQITDERDSDTLLN